MKQTSLKSNEPSTIQEYIEAHIKEIQDFNQRPIDWTIRGKNAVEEAKHKCTKAKYKASLVWFRNNS